MKIVEKKSKYIKPAIKSKKVNINFFANQRFLDSANFIDENLLAVMNWVPPGCGSCFTGY